MDYLPEYCSKPTLILGCGNILLGDDGLGPEVIAYLQSNCPLEDVALVDAGTGVVDILFNIALSDVRPRRIIMVDAMALGKPPGTLSLLSLDSFQGRQSHIYSQHQVPTSGLLRDLEQTADVEVRVLVVEPGHVPEEINPGLSPAVMAAVPKAAELIEMLMADAQCQNEAIQKSALRFC